MLAEPIGRGVAVAALAPARVGGRGARFLGSGVRAHQHDAHRVGAEVDADAARLSHRSGRFQDFFRRSATLVTIVEVTRLNNPPMPMSMGTRMPGQLAMLM